MQEILDGKNPAVNIEIKRMMSSPSLRQVPTWSTSSAMWDTAGGFTLGGQRSVSVLRALALAGGLGRTAKPEKARIVRPGCRGSETQEIAINVQQILSGKAEDISLGPDDVLVIPTSSRKTFTTKLSSRDIFRRRGRRDLPLLRPMMENQPLLGDPRPGNILMTNSAQNKLSVAATPVPWITPVPEVFEEPGPGQLTEYLQIVRRRKGTVLLILFLGLLISLLFTLPQTSTCEARGSIEIQNLNENFLNMRSVSPTADASGVGRARVRCSDSNAGQHSPERILN